MVKQFLGTVVAGALLAALAFTPASASTEQTEPSGEKCTTIEQVESLNAKDDAFFIKMNDEQFALLSLAFAAHGAPVPDGIKTMWAGAVPADPGHIHIFQFDDKGCFSSQTMVPLGDFKSIVGVGA